MDSDMQGGISVPTPAQHSLANRTALTFWDKRHVHGCDLPTQRQEPNRAHHPGQPLLMHNISTVFRL
eukprot:3677429-Heterocapsa_arctica.AAC.1